MLRQLLEDGLNALGVALAKEAREKLLDYLGLLEKWNQTYNLTAARDTRQMVTHHLLDSLSVAAYVKGPRVLDVGTGAGLPGIPLALALPDLEFVLVDSRAKKTRFVRHAVGTLGIGNVEVIQSRVERYRPAVKFDTLVARAFADISAMLEASHSLWGEHGEFLIMKGSYPRAELAAVPDSYKVQTVASLTVPGLAAQRHLVIITRRSD